MPTVKLVVIGASGVGKTSMRSQYISGQFSGGYRATIGADFIVKTIPHPSNPGDKILLQIWDTAGQERFSSLSKAFFRGADAVLLMFDVNAPATMMALTKWWAEFREQAPLADEDMEDFCCVVVGNKIDVSGGEERVTEEEAVTFLTELVPPTTSSPSASPERGDDQAHPPSSSHAPETVEPPKPSCQLHPHRSDSIAITPNSRSTDHQHPSTSRSPAHHLSKSRSRSASHFYGGTMTTTHTTLTIYHTPSSSLFDVYQSARSSPEPRSSPSLSPSSVALSPPPSVRGRARGHARPVSTFSDSAHSTSSGSLATITPSLFAREFSGATPSTTLTADTAPQDDDDDDAFVVFPPPPARGPKLFFTSAKTGAGVPEVFEYIARRVVRRWEYEERLKARRMHVREDTVQIELLQRTGSARTICCGS